MSDRICVHTCTEIGGKKVWSYACDPDTVRSTSGVVKCGTLTTCCVNCTRLVSREYITSESVTSSEDPLEPLRKILDRAYNQALHGKGNERHGNGRPFGKQPIIAIQQLLGEKGTGFPLGQVIKKCQESSRMPVADASAELLGAINYLAAAIYYRETFELED